MSAVDVWAAHVESILSDGLLVEGASGRRQVFLERAGTSCAASAGLNVIEPHSQDLVIVATKAAQVRDALRDGAGLLKTDDPDSCLLLIQNGISVTKELVAEVLGEAGHARILLGIASNFGASMKGPGHTEHKSMNLICIGEMANSSQDGNAVSPRLERIETAWREAGFQTRASPDIHADIWEKLICAFIYSHILVCCMRARTLNMVLNSCRTEDRLTTTNKSTYSTLYSAYY